jgi:Tol biopolymer transport system component
MKSDISRMLEKAAGPPTSAADVGAIIARGRRRRRLHRAGAVVLAVVLLSVVGAGAGRVREAIRDYRAPVAGGVARPPEPAGIVFAATATGDRENAVYVADEDDGDPRQLLDEPVGGETAPAWSPDGTLVAFAMNVAPGADLETVDTNMEIFVMRSDGTALRRLTDHPGLDTNPAWSPDGSRIAFTRWPDGPASESGDRVAIWVVNADGSGLERLTHGSGLADQAEWSPGGERIAFSRYVRSKDAYAIFTIEAHAEGVRRNIAVTHAPHGVSSTSPTWSPDGAHIAFVRDPNQNRVADEELYIVKPDGDNPQRVTAEEGSYNDPTWSPDGRSIGFVRDSRVFVIRPPDREQRVLVEGYTRISGIDWAP